MSRRKKRPDRATLRKMQPPAIASKGDYIRALKDPVEYVRHLDMRPDALAPNPGPDPIVEIPVDAAFRDSHERNIIEMGDNHFYLRHYRMGPCFVIVTRELGQWHMSISRKDRLPSWEEVARARYGLIPDEAFVILCLPPKREYINVHPYCLQLMEIDRDAAGI